ncbi:MAG: multidrug effflux MFS transporter [Burkholderiales bacterium]|nr:multidrug effflux MFS transporter [Burkholderiales bacterium]
MLDSAAARETYRVASQPMPLAPSSTWLTVLLGLLIALTSLGTDSFLPAMPVIARDLGVEPARAQLGLTTFFLGVAAGQLAWGPLSDRLGRRPTLLAGCAVFLAASVGCMFAGSVAGIATMRLLQGLAMSSGPVIARSVVRDLHTREHAARRLAQMQVVFGIMPIAAPLIAGGLLVWLGWPSVFGFHAVMAVAVGAAVVFGLAETAPHERRSIHPLRIAASFGALLADRRFLAPVATLLCGQAGLYAFLANSSIALVGAAGVTPVEYSALFATVMVGQIIGAWLSSRWVTRFGIPRMLRQGARLCAAAGIVMAALAWSGATHWTAVVLPAMVYMFAFSFILPHAIALAMTPFPQTAGAAASLLGAGQFGLGAAVSAVLGAVFDGTARPMAAAMALSGIGALAAEAFRTRASRDPRGTH